MQAPDRPLVRHPALWVLVALFAAEFFIFDQFGSRRFTGVYPRWNDQIQYLGEAYAGHEHARAHGLAAGLWHTLVNPSAQGTLHDFFATLVFAVAGPSRSAALAVNLFALIAWQAALFFAVARTTGSRSLALAAAALPLALAGPWADIPGSAYDFRLDHLAMCALGIASAAALLTEGCRARAWSLAFGVAVGFALLTRFLTGTYFALIFAGGLAWIAAGDERRRRLANLALAAGAAFAIAAPLLWLNREWVWNYYWIGHYVGPESAIRSQGFGLGQSLAFVGGQLGERHLGVFFGALVVLGAIAFRFLRGRDEPNAKSAPPLWTVGGLFLAAPGLVLTLHQQKSEVVVSALAPGVIVLMIAAWHALARPAPGRPTIGLVAAGVMLAALAFFTQRQLRPAFDAAAREEFRHVITLADTIIRRGRAAALPESRVAVDHITDALDAQVIRIIGYERHHVWLPFNMTLPTGIAEPTEAEVMARLALSDFVFLTEEAPAGGFPFDRKLAVLRPQTHAWCEANFRAAERFTLFGRRMVLYQRREIPFP
ncbi:MAG: hypothetical protein JNK23_17495 [Opitutaceae bacterium]|nr:hypothetical protein [Opitutaceae bacterium]